MSRRNETINRLYQRAGILALNKVGMRLVRSLITQAYDAGRAHADHTNPEN